MASPSLGRHPQQLPRDIVNNPIGLPWSNFPQLEKPGGIFCSGRLVIGTMGARSSPRYTFHQSHVRIL